MRSNRYYKRKIFFALPALPGAAALLIALLFAACPGDSGSDAPETPDNPETPGASSTFTYAGASTEGTYTLAVKGSGSGPKTGNAFTLTLTPPAPAAEKSLTGTLEAVTSAGWTFAYDPDRTFQGEILSLGAGGVSLSAQSVAFAGDETDTVVTAALLQVKSSFGVTLKDDDPSNPIPKNWDIDKRTLKITKNGKPWFNTVWGEGYWQDPRIALGYKFYGGRLDGQLWFDQYVQLYGARLTNHNCAADPYTYSYNSPAGAEAPLGSGLETHCTKTGLHLHLDKACYEVLEKRNKYIKPLQDAGIKFLVGFVNKDAGVAFGTLYKWPMDDEKPWQEIWTENIAAGYPHGEDAAARLVSDVKELMEKYQIDGIGFDDEYGSVSNGEAPGKGAVYPTTDSNKGSYSYYSGNTAKIEEAWLRGGRNVFRFCYDLKKAIPNIVIENFEFRYTLYMPRYMDIVDLRDNAAYAGQDVKVYWGDKNDFPESVDGLPVRSLAQTLNYDDYIEFSEYAVYGITGSPTPGRGGGANHTTHSRYSWICCDIGTGQGAGQARPPNNSNFVARIQQIVDGNYGGLMYYALYDHTGYQNNSSYPNYFGPGQRTPEYYFTTIAQQAFYDDAQIIYEGDNYKLPWN